jgi:DNA repair exonuclease SbcCD ATPase subunit
LTNDDNAMLPILLGLKDQIAKADANSRSEHASNSRRLDEIAAKLEQTHSDLAENKRVSSENAKNIEKMLPHVQVLAKKKMVRDAIKSELARWGGSCHAHCCCSRFACRIWRMGRWV